MVYRERHREGDREIERERDREGDRERDRETETEKEEGKQQQQWKKIIMRNNRHLTMEKNKPTTKWNVSLVTSGHLSCV